MIYIIEKETGVIVKVMTEWDFWEEYHEAFLRGFFDDYYSLFVGNL